jgi:hypothetical protein
MRAGGPLERVVRRHRTHLLRTHELLELRTLHTESIHSAASELPLGVLVPGNVSVGLALTTNNDPAWPASQY